MILYVPWLHLGCMHQTSLHNKLHTITHINTKIATTTRGLESASVGVTLKLNQIENFHFPASIWRHILNQVRSLLLCCMDLWIFVFVLFYLFDGGHWSCMTVILWPPLMLVNIIVWYTIHIHAHICFIFFNVLVNFEANNRFQQPT